MGLKAKLLLIIAMISIIGVGCTSNINTQSPSSLLDGFTEKLNSKRNVVFISNTTINRRGQMALVSLRGVQFIENNHIYYIGDASGHRLELFKTDVNTYIKDSEGQWATLKAAVATEIEPFLKNPLRMLEYSEYGDLMLLDKTMRFNGRNNLVLSGTINNSGINKYIRNYLPELLDLYEEIFIEVSFYIDIKNRSLSRIDLFINEYSGDFSLVSEIIITNHNVTTDIIPPK